PGTTRVPSSTTTRPFTETRPARISSSAERRDATPAWASCFCSRSPCALASRFGREFRRPIARLLVLAPRPGARRTELGFVRKFRAVHRRADEGIICTVRTALAQRCHGCEVGCYPGIALRNGRPERRHLRRDLGEIGQLVQRAQTEGFEEER